MWMGGLNPLNNIDKKLNKILITNLNIYYIHMYNIFIRKYVYYKLQESLLKIDYINEEEVR